MGNGDAEWETGTQLVLSCQTRLFNDHPTGKALKSERLDTLMQEGGVADCAKAGNCVEVCPKEIPLLESIASIQRQATVHAFKRFFSK